MTRHWVLFGSDPGSVLSGSERHRHQEENQELQIQTGPKQTGRPAQVLLVLLVLLVPLVLLFQVQQLAAIMAAPCQALRMTSAGTPPLSNRPSSAPPTPSTANQTTPSCSSRRPSSERSDRYRLPGDSCCYGDMGGGSEPPAGPDSGV